MCTAREAVARREGRVPAPLQLGDLRLHGSVGERDGRKPRGSLGEKGSADSMTRSHGSRNGQHKPVGADDQVKRAEIALCQLMLLLRVAALASSVMHSAALRRAAFAPAGPRAWLGRPLAPRDAPAEPILAPRAACSEAIFSIRVALANIVGFSVELTGPYCSTGHLAVSAVSRLSRNEMNAAGATDAFL